MKIGMVASIAWIEDNRIPMLRAASHCGHQMAFSLRLFRWEYS
jgi:hypothetical protein